MTVLRPTPVSTDRFTFNSGTGTFVAEASDLGRPLGQVYDDACDVGLTLVSSVTGTEVVFAEQTYKRDAENTIIATVLVPIDSPRGGISVLLYND